MVKALTAAPNCTVTASMMLTDVVTGTEREVDVVADYDIDGDHFIQSFEVTSTGRRADVTWVEQMLRKHENLITDRLILVSWKGYTVSAKRLAESNPRLVLVTPQMRQGPNGPEVKRMRAVTLRLAGEKVVFVVVTPNGDELRVVVNPDHHLLKPDRTYASMAFELTNPMLGSPDAFRATIEELGKHDSSEELTNFSLETTILPDAELYLHQFEVDELHRLVGVEIYGSLKLVSQPLSMEVREFGEERFAHGIADFMGEKQLFVASLDRDDEVTAIMTRRGDINSRMATIDASMYRQRPSD